MSTEQKKYWFAPKVYGRWFVPISREGWVVVVVMIIAIAVAAPLTLWFGKNPWRERGLLYIAFITLVTVGPFFLMKWKSKGTLKWRRWVKDIDRE